MKKVFGDLSHTTFLDEGVRFLQKNPVA